MGNLSGSPLLEKELKRLSATKLIVNKVKKIGKEKTRDCFYRPGREMVSLR